MSFFSGTIFTEKLRNIIDINLENDEKWIEVLPTWILSLYYRYWGKMQDSIWVIVERCFIQFKIISV